MNNLCCVIQPANICYYCEGVWCLSCWSKMFAGRGLNFDRCSLGNFPGGDDRGGHYTYTYGGSIYDKSYVDRHWISRAAATVETDKKIAG